MQLALIPILSQAEPIVDSHWTTNAQINIWLLAGLGLVAIVAAFYLYRAQRRIAPAKAVFALTAIRTLLILMMFLVLLGAARVFTWTGKVNGTLWLLLDQSESMERTDAHAPPIEKLRWADAMGLVPAGVRTGALDRQAIRLSVLGADVNYYQSLARAGAAEKDQRKQVEDIVRGLKQWNSLLTGVADTISKSPIAGDDGTIARELRTVVDAVAKGIEKIDTRQKPEEAQNDVDWNLARTTLAAAATKLQAAADKADQAILSLNDSRVTEALEKVSTMTRAQLAKAVITDKSKADAPGFDVLMPKQTVKVMGFGQRPQTIIPDDQADAGKAVKTALSRTVAPVTDVASALQAIQDQLSQNEPATVVMVGDGRQNRREADTAEAVSRLASRGVRVYSIATGTGKVAPDAAVETIEAPDWVFKGDTIKISSLLRLDGLDGKRATVELHRLKVADGRSGDGNAPGTTDASTLIDTKEIDVKRPREVITFTEKKENLPDAGLYDYRIQIKEIPGETVVVNNNSTVRVNVKDTKLTVLYLDNVPRWEYQYITNYFERDHRIKLQTMLLQPARIGWDTDPSKNIKPPDPRKPSTDLKDTRVDFQILPETQEEWYQWRFIVIGDIPPEKLPKKQQEMIVKAVTDGGATLLILSGHLNMPGAWGAGQPLSALFPCEPSPDWTPGKLQQHLKIGYHPVIAPDGENHLLTQFGIDEETNRKVWETIRTDPNLAWYWHTDDTLARGGASVIWSIEDGRALGQAAPTPSTNPADANAITALETARKRALLATMNAGLGQVMYLAGDATWRLRQVNGINYHERLWGQVIRWVVSGDLPAGGEFVRFGTDKPRYVGGEQASVTARIVNTKLVPQTGLKVKVRARVLSATGQIDPNSKAVVEAEMSEIPDAPGRYRATLGNLPPGQVELTLQGAEVEKLLADDTKALQKSLTVEVVDTLNLEKKNINADRPALSSIAAAGGGVMVDGAYADILAEHIPELSYTDSSAEQISLFGNPNGKYSRTTHWVFLAVFVGLITAEWIIRKANGLV
ncbi:vWA domain-containing protein [Humisphaera borealis]|uniref:VWA domain-containing protein n=1 Tax=Humisphaera borealis TaxID=2807512 RepID=A0A7M2WU85_9BACT|nr:vWA domain-containing protein [Humisphaera borealis]QOV89087.1 VWA domain-containing protein [Humisphaera borealis]